MVLEAGAPGNHGRTFSRQKPEVVVTIGMLRKAGTDPVHRGAEHLTIPMPVDPPPPLKQTRRVELGANAAAASRVPIQSDLVSQIRSGIKPRRLSPPDITGRATERTERVALAN